MSEWDSRLPATPDDVIALLERRIEVHEAWAAAGRHGFSLAGELAPQSHQESPHHAAHGRNREDHSAEEGPILLDRPSDFVNARFYLV